ncbi:MAG: D-alanyl-D-alanine carboxypeptidase [Oscillospiraceae bacterium]|nr:D-alanyl-D-alanine carboxypeptidase [Oscillospiraceae bacterium]
MKKILSIFLVYIIFCNIFIGYVSYAEENKKSMPIVNSESVYMVNTDSETVIYEKNPNKKIAPASLVKIMTAILTIENIEDIQNTKIESKGYIYDEFVNINISNADIKRGEIITVEDLLYALVLQSAGEAASILADYIGEGSIDKFVSMMNDKAKELGAMDTNFTNPHGLDDKDQYTTAKDMYTISKYAMKNPIFNKISTTNRYEMKPTNKHQTPRYVVHTNLMIDKNRGGKYYYSYAKGIKTGTTDKAGRNLISTASKNGYNYMLVTMGGPMYDSSGKKFTDNYAFIDGINLYNWAFDNFIFKKIVGKNTSVDEIKLKLSFKRNHILLSSKEDFYHLMDKNIDMDKIEKKIEKPNYIKAPIKVNDVIGKVIFSYEGNQLGEVDLISTEDVSKNLLLEWFNIIDTILSYSIVQIILIIILFYFIFMFIKKKNMKKYKKIK